MCRLQCLLVFGFITITTVNSWDIAITAKTEIEFYDKGIKVSKVDVPNGSLTALAYDAVHNLLFFVNKHSDNASVFSYNFTSKTIRPLVKKKMYEQIEGVAFDPITGRLFWTDLETRGIYYKSLKGNEKGDETLLFKVEDQNPRAIAVDSCRGYIYWSNIAFNKATIMKARFDGTQETPDVVVNTEIFRPVSIAIDQRERKIYWADDDEGIHYSIWSADLDGKNKTLLSKSTEHRPNSLAVSKDSVFWIDWDQSTVWKIPKAGNVVRPEAVISFGGTPFGIVANYPIEEQTEDIEECHKLLKQSLERPLINGSIDVPMDAGVYCLHGHPVDSTTCRCTQGYTGDRCEIPVCHNYCLQGQCQLSSDGEPKCKCDKGFTGQRCDVDQCLNYCLNDGQCAVNARGRPTCICAAHYEGRRCEKLKPEENHSLLDGDTTTEIVNNGVTQTSHISTTTTVAPSKPESCNCSSQSKALTVNEDEFIASDDCDGWDSVRDPIIMFLGVISGLLCVICAFLITKIMHLKRRPRIKKRIIVNKNVTPLTARPDQCEITIENCCNMNICETPCFEPRSTIRPTLRDAKPGKEEKKNLISNMELPDD